MTTKTLEEIIRDKNNSNRSINNKGGYVQVMPSKDSIERYGAGEKNIYLSRTDRRILEEEA